MKKLLIVIACAALTASACSGNNEDNNDTDAGSTVQDTGGDEDTGGGGGDDMGGGGGDDMGGGGGDDMGGGGGDMGGGGDDMGGGGDDMGGGGDDMSGGDDMGADMGMTRLEAHGCTYDTATDMTGMATVDLSGIQAWSVPHNVCIIVDVGTVVSWTGNFTVHPLEGGEGGTQDAANPIDIAGDGVTGNDTVSVTFDMAGDYPYYCGIHVGTMNGVVYVD